MHGLLDRDGAKRTSTSTSKPLTQVTTTSHSSCAWRLHPVLTLLVQRFKREGCPNCEEFLGLAGSDEQVDNCTSSVFEGLITLAEPGKSWVAKWQRLDGYVKGVYATKVMGQLPEDLVSQMEEQYKVRYIP